MADSDQDDLEECVRWWAAMTPAERECWNRDAALTGAVIEELLRLTRQSDDILRDPRIGAGFAAWQRMKAEESR